MKKTTFQLLLLLLLCNACSPANVEKPATSPPTEPTTHEIPQLQATLDSLSLKGSVLIYEASTNRYFSNNFPRTQQKFLPASTFKIANSIIGLETGVLKDEKHLFAWDGEARGLKSWEKDLDLQAAFHASCVPCYRQLARQVGLEKMQTWTNKLQFGQMVVDEASLDLFWLEGPSRISQMEQIDFLQRFYLQKLPISNRTYEIMKPLMVREKTANYQLSGKTGLSIRGTERIGWFVGYVEKGDEVYFLATNLEPATAAQNSLVMNMRVSLTMQALRTLDILPQR